MHSRLYRMLFRLMRTVTDAEHPLRRLRAAIDGLHERGLLTSQLEGQIVHELALLEEDAHASNDGIEQLAGRLNRLAAARDQT